ncbi:MAG: hypothetical protein ACRD2T_09320 [Thermoanaerobaculia bacterium]
MKRPLLLVLLASLATAATLHAGTVYVPVTKDEVQGKVYRTKVWVTNTSSVARRFSHLFLPAETDGTKRGATTPAQTLTVPAGGTLLLSSLGPAHQIGLLEISGAPQLVVTARLEASDQTAPAVASAHLPVLSSDNLVEGGKTAFLQGLARGQAGLISNLGIVNLAQAATQCTISAFRSNGTQIGTNAVITLQPLSSREFADAYGLLQEAAIADSAFAVNCAEDFYAYATVLDPVNTQAVYVTPAYSLASTLKVPGEPGGPPGSVEFLVPGVFLDAKPGDSFKVIDLPANPTTRYKKAIVEFDLRVGPMTLGPRNFYGVTSFRRNDRTLFYGLIVRDDRDKTILDMGVEDDIVTGSNGGPWKANSNYYVIFEYDTDTELLSFKLFRAGVLVEQLTGDINHTDLIANNNLLRVDFGMKGIADFAYFPPIGWRYSNLKVTLETFEN